MLPVALDAAEALFRVVDAADEKRSIALTSNIHPAGFDELMPKTLATATVIGCCTTRTPADRRQRFLPPRPSDRRTGDEAPHLTGAALRSPLHPAYGLGSAAT
jgi:hypothetical protein